MKKNYYAVKKGVTPGIYTSWELCRENITGFSGAVYKGFATYEEAAAFMGGISYDKSETLSADTDIKEKTDVSDITCPDVHTFPYMSKCEKDHAVAYVDGSYNSATKEYSYGAVLLYNNEERHFNEKFDDEEKASMRNVAGELEGAMFAMRFCLDNGIKSLDLYYDYAGIECWCTGKWKTNKNGTIEYKKFYDSIRNDLAINFKKVKSHSGNKYNDLADRLAKEILGI